MYHTHTHRKQERKVRTKKTRGNIIILKERFGDPGGSDPPRIFLLYHASDRMY